MHILQNWVGALIPIVLVVLVLSLACARFRRETRLPKDFDFNLYKRIEPK